MATPSDFHSNVRHLDADDLYLERVHSARAQSLEEKLFAGIELFELACEFMRAGIRAQHPGASDERIEELVEQRLALGRRLEAGS